MRDRVRLLGEHGVMHPWLVRRVRAMSEESWQRFYTEIRSGLRAMPMQIEETMPRNAEGLIANPESEPEFRRADELAKWEAWEAFWGPAPWREPIYIRPRPVRFSRD